MPGELRLADAQRAIAREHGHVVGGISSGHRTSVERARALGGAYRPRRLRTATTTAQAALLREFDGGDDAGTTPVAYARPPPRCRERRRAPRAGDGRRRTTGDSPRTRIPDLARTRRGTARRVRGWHRARRHPEHVAAALAAIRTGDGSAPQAPTRLNPDLVHVEVGGGGSLLGAVAHPDVFGTSLRHGLGVDRACVDLLIERGATRWSAQPRGVL